MKRFLSLALATVTLLSTPVFANAVLVDNTPVEFTDQEPVIINERTYVPIRDVFEKLGFEVSWDQETKMVDITNDYYSISLLTASDKLVVTSFVNGVLKYKKLEDPVVIQNDRTLLPLRAILESAGYELDFDAETKAAIINDTNNYNELDEKINAIKESMSKEEREFTAAPNKEAVPLTEDEKAYILGFATALKGFDSVSDIDEYPTEELEKVFSSAEMLLDSTTPPDSLKELHPMIKKTFSEVKETVLNLKGLQDFIADEPDNVKMNLTLYAGLASVVGLSSSLNEINESIYNLSVERNIDIAKEIQTIAESVGLKSNDIETTNEDVQ